MDINTREKIVVEACIECNKVSKTMYRIRNNFCVIGVVCETCYNMYYKKDYKNDYLTFNKPTDNAGDTGVGPLPNKSSFMRLHRDTNFESSESRKQKLLKNKIYRENAEVLENYYEAMLTMYYLSDSDEISISGQYQVIEFINNDETELRCYYTVSKDNVVIPRFIMNDRGKIIQYLQKRPERKPTKRRPQS